MPNNQQGFDLKALKTDPKMWMRLTMSSKNGEYLENVFKDKENPFEKNTQAAVETIERLAAEGKLYLRDLGRSRHFHKVEKTGDELKLGEQHEMKFSNRTSGWVLGGLMWLSRGYFKWLGLNRISNWFDGRLKRRSELKELNNRYKEEYKSFTKEEKKELKALRKHEKIVKKLEKIQKEVERSEQTLNELRGQQAPTATQQAPTATQQIPTATQQEPTATQQVPTATQQEPTAPQQQAPLAQPPEIKPNENTMQPTLLGDQPVQQIPPAPPLPNQFTVQQTTVQEIPGIKKEENEQGENTKDNKIIINGVELTDETVNLFPPHVVEAFRVIQQMIIDQQTAIRANQQEQAPAQPEANREEQVLTDAKLPVNLQGVDDLEMNQNEPAMNTHQVEDVFQQANLQGVDEPEMNQNEPAMNTHQVENVFQPVNIPNVAEREMTQEELERMFDHIEEPEMTQEELERMFEGTDAPTMDGALPSQEINAPLKNGADLEPEQVNMQQRHKDQAQAKLQEQLAAEKKDMDSVANWKDMLANTLFSHEEGGAMRDNYQMINRSNEEAGAEFVSGIVFGVLASKTADPAQKQQVLDALLSGKPLGSEHKDLISSGMTAYNDAYARKTSQNPERMADMLAESIKALSRQASRETTLSPRAVLIGRLLGKAAQMANENGLELPLDEEEMSYAHGAVTLAEVAEKYHDARQQLGNDLANIGSRQSRGAVRNLLMGNAVEKAIQQDKRLGQTITNTMQFMGGGLWSLENLKAYTSASATRRGIQPEDIQALLEKPNSTKALGIGTSTMKEIIQASQEDYIAARKAMEKEMELGQQENQLEIDPVQMPV